MALNVVLSRTVDPRGLTVLADRYRREHPRARVIVRFFRSTAGPERFVVGYVPSDSASLPVTSGSDAALATFDFPPPTASPTNDAR
ncbi:MAG TPA: hypothetical protein VFM38_15460 [Candidatus Limnocylindrales bacterium]|nr:hypothetical protein [Candidatus Limnocylindrales bacterium]